MSLSDLVLEHVLSFTLVWTRLAGFVVVSPFPGDHVSRRQRAGLVAGIAFMTTLYLTPQPLKLDATLIPLVATEMGIGLLIGLAFRILTTAADVMGDLISQAVGLGTPAILNPVSGVQDTVIGQITSFFAVLLVLTSGVHRVVIAYVLESFRAIPVGSPVSLVGTLPIFIEIAGESISCGARLAIPIAAISLAIQAALAMIARAAPSLQIFSVGFTIMILAGLTAFATGMPDMGIGLLRHFSSIPELLDRILTQIVTT